MQSEDYVSLDVAKLLDKLKIQIPTLYYRVNKDTDNHEIGSLLHKNETSVQFFNKLFLFPAPTLYEVQMRIWQHHQLLVNAFIKSPFALPHEFMYCIQDAKNSIDDYGTFISDPNTSFESIQQALNEGILYVLNTLYNEKNKEN